jgi:hypothetical protein
MFWLIPVSLAAVEDVFLTNQFSIQTMKLQQKDSLVFQIQEGSHKIVQVTKDGCEVSKASDQLNSGQNYMYQFNDAGVYFFATEQGCQNGFRMVVEVEATPVNPYAQQFVKAEQKFLMQQKVEEKKSSAIKTSIGLLTILCWLL